MAEKFNLFLTPSPYITTYTAQMTPPSALPAPAPTPSALSTHLKTSVPISTSTSAAPTHPAHLHHLAAQITHNLRHQHDWTDLHVVTHSPHPPYKLLSRPLIIGLPPERIYIHPDEQLEILQRQRQRQKRKEGRQGAGGERIEEVEEEEDDDEKPQRVWVLPTHLREKWSLRKFAEVFDEITRVPPVLGLDEDGDVVGRGSGEEELVGEDGEDDDGGGGGGGGGGGRKAKRVLLATLSDDSTVVYYIVHDAIVKPRQN
ncbi:MAG: hypothetical protein M1816_000199 [Peltula sp. TS41687]|nr:MAG: hypothetical protein M1816_000199 [Peltula sp. TS41687]